MHRPLALFALVVFGASGALAQAQAPDKPALAWSVSVEPDEGFKLEYGRALAVHADGTALLAMPEEKGEGEAARRRVLLVGVSPGGQILAQTWPLAETAESITGIALAAEADGFALVTATAATGGDPNVTRVTLHRLAPDGRVRGSQPLRFGRRPMHEISGVAADGRGNVIVYGGVYDGPHAPAMAAADRSGRVAWFFAGKDPMPPGGVRAVRFRRDGGNDALVIDKEKPFWERRSAQGRLLARAALPRHWDCWAFLDENRLVSLFYNWEERRDLRAPAKHWVAALVGPNGRSLPGERAFDAAARQDASCILAANGAGWIALSLEPAKIALLDGALKTRAEIDLAAAGATRVEALAVDAKGAVTALVDTAPINRPGRRVRLLRFAPVAR